MPRFFFNVQGSATIEDKDGTVLDSPADVHDLAVERARELLAEGSAQGFDRTGWSFRITDEKGRTVLNFRFGEALQKTF